MSIIKRGSSYRAAVYIDGRCVETKSFTKKGDALDWRDKTRTMYRSGYQKAAVSYFAEIVDEFEKTVMTKLARPTLRRYLVDLAHIGEFFGHLRIEHVNSFRFETFQNKLIEKGLSPRSVNHVTDLLAQIVRKARTWKLADLDFSLKKLKLPKTSYCWWDDRRDIEAFLSAAKTHKYYHIYLIALETGMRLSEIIGLCKRDIDFRFNRIQVNRQWLEEEKAFGPTKGRRERFIDFNPTSTLAAELRCAVNKSTHDELLFCSSLGLAVSGNKISQRYMGPIVKKAGVPSIRFHDLRHTFASWYMIEIGDIWMLKEMLGHRDIATTMKYAHCSDRHRKTPLDLSSRLNPKDGGVIVLKQGAKR